MSVCGCKHKYHMKVFITYSWMLFLTIFSVTNPYLVEVTVPGSPLRSSVAFDFLYRVSGVLSPWVVELTWEDLVCSSVFWMGLLGVLIGGVAVGHPNTVGLLRQQELMMFSGCQ